VSCFAVAVTRSQQLRSFVAPQLVNRAEKLDTQQSQLSLTIDLSTFTFTGMEVRLSPEIEAQLDQLARESGRPKDEFVQDALAGYFDEIARLSNTLDRRYDEIKNGTVKPISGDEARARLVKHIESLRSKT
jgi:predicted DNA-binding protein